MTNIKARGFDNAEQLREHLAELDDEAPADDPTEDAEGIDPRDQIAALRKEVAELHQRLASIRDDTDCVSSSAASGQAWRRIAATVAATFVFRRLFHKLRLGNAGTAAVLLIATQLGRRF